MGFRSGAYATIWEVTPKSDVNTVCRLSISRKNKMTGEYETDFSGFVGFIGSVAAKKAANLKEKDRVRLGDVDVSTSYDKVRNINYTNYKCFSFEMADAPQAAPVITGNEPFMQVDEGIDEDLLPF